MPGLVVGPRSHGARTCGPVTVAAGGKFSEPRERAVIRNQQSTSPGAAAVAPGADMPRSAATCVSARALPVTRTAGAGVVPLAMVRATLASAAGGVALGQGTDLHEKVGLPGTAEVTSGGLMAPDSDGPFYAHTPHGAFFGGGAESGDLQGGLHLGAAEVSFAQHRRRARPQGSPHVLTQGTGFLFVDKVNSRPTASVYLFTGGQTNAETRATAVTRTAPVDSPPVGRRFVDSEHGNEDAHRSSYFYRFSSYRRFETSDRPLGVGP